MAADGLTTIRSSYGPSETTNKLEAAVKVKGMTVFAHIDHAAGAAAIGLALRPTELLAKVSLKSAGGRWDTCGRGAIHGEGGITMKRLTPLLIAVATLVGVVAFTARAPRHAAAQQAGPIFVTDIPSGYRDWRLISVAHEEGDLHSFAAVLGNDVAIKAYREGKLLFPDGTIIAALHYRHIPSEENNKVFGRDQSFVAGPPTNIQFMIKDSRKYAATGGWGFGHFQDGKASTDEAMMKTCFPCHQQTKARDLVFTRYAP